MGATAVSISRLQIQQVYEVIGPYLRLTPTLDATGADFGLGPVRLTFKLEQLQYAGSFKTRGAFAHLLTRKIPGAGVVAASGGSHGVAVADAARRLGVRAKIFVPRVASPAKVDRIRASGADLEIVGERYADALAASEAWAQSSGALVIHAFDQIETLLGQGTIGLELNDQAPALDTVLVPVGGGGLIAGVSTWYAGSAQVVGVEPEEAPTLTRALAAGRPVDAPAGGIAAESLAPQRVGELVFPIVRAHVSKVTLVTDAAIRRAQHALWDQLRVVAEPGGATAFAALLSRAYVPRPDERVGVLVSGGNTADVMLSPVA
ncbi:MAG TPA: threonine/serine dehydratase [Vicinamibacterales bacterium]|nr:threonine/serine dehydratase [Vicinamibacterales bacterium]